MRQVEVSQARTAPRRTRLIGTYRGQDSGPLLLVVAGVHGNEPSGILALERVFAALETQQPAFHGDLVAIAGNVTALDEGRRFIQEDLNRCWSEARMAALRSTDPSDLGVEGLEQRELLETIEDEVAGARGALYFLDLHSTSSTSVPFLTLSDTIRTRAFALRFSLPLVLGLEEQLDGTLLDYMYSRGEIAALGVEAGRHDAAVSVDRHEWVVWRALELIGALKEPLPGAVEAQARLAAAAAGMSLAYEVIYRHAIEPADRFRMLPGFANFQAVRAGEMLGRDRRGPVRSPLDGHLFLPLYQELGDDGFFIVREIRPFWLKISATLRHLRFDRILTRLPGVRPYAGDPDTFVVNRRVARWFVAEIFHLLGFRRLTSTDGEIVVRRRRHDRRRPPQDSRRTNLPLR